MKARSLTDVKNNLSRYVEQVRHGERIRVLVHGVPAADLVPVGPDATRTHTSQKAPLVELERLGIVRGAKTRFPAKLLDRGPSCGGRPLSAYIDEERAGGR